MGFLTASSCWFVWFVVNFLSCVCRVPGLPRLVFLVYRDIAAEITVRKTPFCIAWRRIILHKDRVS